MTLTVPLSPEEQAALQAQAKAQGLSIDSLVRKAVLQIIAAAPEVPGAQKLSVEEWEKALDECFDSFATTGPLPDDAFRRENIYGREDKW